MHRSSSVMKVERKNQKYKIFKLNIPGTWILHFLLASFPSEITDSELQNILSILQHSSKIYELYTFITTINLCIDSLDLFVMELV